MEQKSYYYNTGKHFRQICNSYLLVERIDIKEKTGKVKMLENMLKWRTDRDTNLTIVYLSTFILIYLFQRCLQTIVRLVSLSVLHFNIFSISGAIILSQNKSRDLKFSINTLIFYLSIFSPISLFSLSEDASTIHQNFVIL